MKKYILCATLIIHSLALHGMQLTIKQQKNLEATLRHATIVGEIEIVDTCIKSRANIYATNRDGHSPLMLAAWQGHIQICELLVQKMLAPTSSQQKEICIFLGCLKKKHQKGDYYNLRNIFEKQFHTFCKEINRSIANNEIKKALDPSIRSHLFKMLL